MQTRLLITIIILAAVLAPAQAGSIYAKRDQTAVKPIYADDKANQIGDVLTIVILEDSKIDNQVDRDLSKNTERSLSIRNEDIFIDKFQPIPNVGISTSGEKSHESEADYTDERTFEDQITVVVEDIHPNGNLVVIGTRTRDVSGDKQTIQISGIVRPRDIAFDNTVPSSKVANLTLVNLTDGPSKDFNNPGWLASLIDKIWPF